MSAGSEDSERFGGNDQANQRDVFEPLPKQAEFLTSDAGQLLLSGSFGAGKSRIGCEKGHMLNMKYPGNRGLIVRESLVDVKASTIRQTLLEEVIPESHIPENGHNKSENRIVHYTGTQDPTGEPVLSEIYYYGLDSGRKTGSDQLPRKIGSMSYGWIFLDEGTETVLGEWNQLQGRLRYSHHEQNGYRFSIPLRQIFTATNPASPNHYLHRKFFEEKQGEVWKMNLHDNKHLPQDYVERLENGLSGLYYERYIEGKWVGAEGIVYPEWDPDIHLLREDSVPSGFAKNGEEEFGDGDIGIWWQPPEGWKVYRSVDFGYRNPMVVQWWAHSPDDVLYLYRELYQTETLVSDMADQMREEDPQQSVGRMVADHDAENHAQLGREGFSTVNADKSVEDGIQSVKKRLSPEKNGGVGLFVLRGARVNSPSSRLRMEEDVPTSTAEEVYSYEWDEDEEEPVKEDDHGLDALRYMVQEIDGGHQIDEEERKEWEEAVNGAF